MQSSVIEATRDEDESAIQSISRQISSFTQGTKLEIENFKISTEKAENGLTLEFALRATVRFPEKEKREP
jgi:hypothetical protein